MLAKAHKSIERTCPGSIKKNHSNTREFLLQVLYQRGQLYHHRGLGYPVNSPTCKLAYAKSPTTEGEFAYVGDFVLGEFTIEFE